MYIYIYISISHLCLCDDKGLRSKVDMPNSVTHLIWTPIFEWYVARCGSKNGYKKDMCLKEIALRAQT